MARRDPHSYNDDTQVETEHVALALRVDFAAHTLAGTATLAFKAPAATGGPLDLDTRDLTIEAVTDADGHALPFTLHPPEPILGARLSIELPTGTTAVTIRYRTSPEASALQWLEPAQTLGGARPFLFSQCQAIHARSVVPLQDTPRLRIRYTAELTIPRELTAVMAAAHTGRTEITEHDGTSALAVDRWGREGMEAWAVSIDGRRRRDRQNGTGARRGRGPLDSRRDGPSITQPNLLATTQACRVRERDRRR